ncbi:L-methionine (R)-S-oxide reductase [Malassezia cuniculi]|uniref:L-methionine (R)-S-oxide reductase n=1 Tax=Malassezia cuniculi TaxID=948313 RepID=A0AAF0J6P4_9BASI|nr:L-methionine (R)-S-oxide reductase [Malassezia cuniculi]
MVHIQSKADFYEHIELQITGLLDGQRNWVTNLANASSVLFNSMNRYEAWREKRVNWAGFYLLSPLFPGAVADVKGPTLWLAPFCGQPACQAIASVPGRGVCADGSSLLPPRAVVVPKTDDYRRGPAEAVRAWGGRGSGDDVIIGVIDIDCEAQAGFDEQDAEALERIARRIVDACDW